MGQTQSYQALEVDDDLENVLEEEEVIRFWDCVMVFEEGEEEVDFVPPVNPHALEYDYLGLLDQEEREKRRARFSLVAADMGGSTRSEKEFFTNERRLVLNALQYKSLLNEEVRSDDLKSTGRKFYYIGIMEPTARQAAADFEYELKLEPEYVITFLNLAGNELAKATFEDEHINEDLWRNLFVKYVDGIPAEVYNTHVMLNQNERQRYSRSLFRIKDRIALIYEMISQDMENGGCGIIVERLRYDRCHPLCDFFPIHQAEQLDLIMDDLFSMDYETWLQLPCDDIRAYFGEYIGIYFAFLEYFTLFLIPLSIIGAGFFCMQLAFNRVLTHGIEWFAICVIIAAIAFPSMWRSKEYEWSTRWGQLRFDFQERARPQFSGEYQRSHIDGRMIEYYPESERATKQAVSLTIVVCFLLALVMSTVGIVALRLWASKVATSMSDYIVSIANALVIIFFNNIYGGFAEMMNTWENYETETAYENNLIVKVFVFRFVNSYASLYYMAFFRKYEKFDDSLSCSAEECMADLTSQLAVIFITQLFVSNATELGTLYATRVAAEQANEFFEQDENEEKREKTDEEKKLELDEDLKQRVYHEYHSEVYERTFDDYNELLINWGYCTLFVLAFPLAPFFGFISLLVESRIDGYKLCRLVRRPFPRRADDIGAWQGAIEFMTWSIMGTNLFLICFESKALRINPGYKNDGLVMIVTTCIVFAMLSCIWGAIEWHYKKMPPPISEHIERTNHIESVLSRRSQDVREWMNDINNDDLIQWKKWGIEAVLMYLSKSLCKNEKEHERITQLFRYHKIDGEKFAKLTPEQLAAYGIKDAYIATLIVKVRGILKKFAADAKKQAQAIDDLAAESKEDGAAASLETVPSFKFLPKHVSELASYLERGLKGQAKKKLWDRVDRDGSGLIEEDEMDLFLYFSISVFIKEKFPSARIPSAKDQRLNRKIIGPMKAWLLHFKVSPHGLSYDEFERYFPSWLREYYRETLSRGDFGKDVDDFKSPIASPKSSSAAHDHKSGYSMPGSTEMTTRRPANEHLWIPLLGDVVAFVNGLPEKPRKTIWGKVAKKAPSMDSSKALPRLLMILFQLYHKKKQASKFEFHNTDLHQIVTDLTAIIRGYLKDPNVIHYEEFLKNIHRFFQKGVKKFEKDRAR